MSLLQALENNHPDTAGTMQCLLSLPIPKLDLLYVPGYKDVPGNEIADHHAKAAARLPGEADVDQSVPFIAVKSAIRRCIKDPEPTHRVTKEFFEDEEKNGITTRVCLVKMKRDMEQIKSRRDGTTLAQLRSGHFMGLGYYDALVDQSQAFANGVTPEKPTMSSTG